LECLKTIVDVLENYPEAFFSDKGSELLNFVGKRFWKLYVGQEASAVKEESKLLCEIVSLYCQLMACTQSSTAFNYFCALEQPHSSNSDGNALLIAVFLTVVSDKINKFYESAISSASRSMIPSRDDVRKSFLSQLIHDHALMQSLCMALPELIGVSKESVGHAISELWCDILRNAAGSDAHTLRERYLPQLSKDLPELLRGSSSCQDAALDSLCLYHAAASNKDNQFIDVLIPNDQDVWKVIGESVRHFLVGTMEGVQSLAVGLLDLIFDVHKESITFFLRELSVIEWLVEVVRVNGNLEARLAALSCLTRFADENHLWSKYLETVLTLTFRCLSDITNNLSAGKIKIDCKNSSDLHVQLLHGVSKLALRAMKHAHAHYFQQKQTTVNDFRSIVLNGKIVEPGCLLGPSFLKIEHLHTVQSACVEMVNNNVDEENTSVLLYHLLSYMLDLFADFRRSIFIDHIFGDLVQDYIPTKLSGKLFRKLCLLQYSLSKEGGAKCRLFVDALMAAKLGKFKIEISSIFGP